MIYKSGIKKIIMPALAALFFCPVWAVCRPQAPKKIVVPSRVKYGIKIAATAACFGSLAPFLKDAWIHRNWVEFSKGVAFGGAISYGTCEHTQSLLQGAIIASAGLAWRAWSSGNKYTALKIISPAFLLLAISQIVEKKFSFSNTSIR